MDNGQRQYFENKFDIIFNKIDDIKDMTVNKIDEVKCMISDIKTSDAVQDTELHRHEKDINKLGSKVDMVQSYFDGNLKLKADKSTIGKLGWGIGVGFTILSILITWLGLRM